MRLRNLKPIPTLKHRNYKDLQTRFVFMKVMRYVSHYDSEGLWFNSWFLFIKLMTSHMKLYTNGFARYQFKINGHVK